MTPNLSPLLVFFAALALLDSARAAPPPLQYEGISATTTLADLQARFPGEVELVAPDDAPGPHPVSATLRFAPKPLGLASYLDYYERAGEERVIRLFFAQPAPHPQNERDLSCHALLGPLRAAFGREPRVEQSDEESFHHIKHIWTRDNQTMTLDCGHLPKAELVVDRLYFECRGVCR